MNEEGREIVLARKTTETKLFLWKCVPRNPRAYLAYPAYMESEREERKTSRTLGSDRTVAYSRRTDFGYNARDLNSLRGLKMSRFEVSLGSIRTGMGKSRVRTAEIFDPLPGLPRSVLGGTLTIWQSHVI